jgi:hypothetical protein
MIVNIFAFPPFQNILLLYFWRFGLICMQIFKHYCTTYILKWRLFSVLFMRILICNVGLVTYGQFHGIHKPLSCIFYIGCQVQSLQACRWHSFSSIHTCRVAISLQMLLAFLSVACKAVRGMLLCHYCADTLLSCFCVSDWSFKEW